jgi:hypothetical protein
MKPEITEAIRSVLKLNGPQSVSQLVKATGHSDHNVRVALSADTTITITRRGHLGMMYGISGIHAPKPKVYPKPYVSEFKELRRDPFAHRDLALAGR